MEILQFLIIMMTLIIKTLLIQIILLIVFFASALAEEGIFTSIAEEDISKVSSAEDLVSLIDKEVSLRLDEKQRRIDEALNASVSPKEVTQYENVISYLDGLDDITINSEEAEGTTLREKLDLSRFY